MPVYNKRGILLLPKVIVLNPKDGKKSRFYAACKVFFYYSTVKLPDKLICVTLRHYHKSITLTFHRFLCLLTLFYFILYYYCLAIYYKINRQIYNILFNCNRT